MRWQPRDLAGNEISICDQVKTIQLFVEREQTDYLLDMLNEIELKYRLSLAASATWMVHSGRTPVAWSV
jgi:hypothetical protein